MVGGGARTGGGGLSTSSSTQSLNGSFGLDGGDPSHAHDQVEAAELGSAGPGMPQPPQMPRSGSSNNITGGAADSAAASALPSPACLGVTLQTAFQLFDALVLTDSQLALSTLPKRERKARFEPLAKQLASIASKDESASREKYFFHPLSCASTIAEARALIDFAEKACQRLATGPGRDFEDRSLLSHEARIVHLLQRTIADPLQQLVDLKSKSIQTQKLMYARAQKAQVGKLIIALSNNPL